MGNKNSKPTPEEQIVAQRAAAKQKRAEAARAAGLPIPNRIVKPGQVTVRVVAQTVGEDHGVYHKGETFLTSEGRAAALGHHVEIVPETLADDGDES